MLAAGRRGDRMSKVFNGVLQAVSTLIGVLMVCMGGIWILQGFNLAFTAGSFMAGDLHWALWGAILLALGLGQAWWSVTRKH